MHSLTYTVFYFTRLYFCVCILDMALIEAKNSRQLQQRVGGNTIVEDNKVDGAQASLCLIERAKA